MNSAIADGVLEDVYRWECDEPEVMWSWPVEGRAMGDQHRLRANHLEDEGLVILDGYTAGRASESSTSLDVS